MEVEMKIRGLMMGPRHEHAHRGAQGRTGASDPADLVGVYERTPSRWKSRKCKLPADDHDLLKNVLLGLEVRVQKIVVNDLKDDTFYALIWVEREGQMMTIDSRP